MVSTTIIMPIKINNRSKFFSGKSSDTSSEGQLVIDLDRPSSAYEASASSLETSLDTSLERLLAMTTQLAAPRQVPQAECELKRFCERPRKIGIWPINKTSENLRNECFVDEDGHWAWKEDPNDQVFCGHCGYVIDDHDRQVVNWPCWHRSHVECAREYKAHHWNKLVMYCVYKACKMPIVDDGDDLFNKDQTFFQELAPWRSMVTFRQLVKMTHEEIRSLEAVIHNHRIKFGWKWDPTYLRHYRQPMQDEIRNIIIKDEYMHDLPMSLNGVKMRVNRRRFQNGTEFPYFANHESEKHPNHVWEMDWTEMTDIGFFGNYDTDQETRERVWKKVGRALLSGAQEVDFRNEFGITIEFQSRRGFLKNFIVTNEGRVEPLDFDDHDDDDEGRQDGRPRYRPPTQNRFHEGDLAAMDAQNEEAEDDDLIQDELEHLENGDILERLLKASASTVDKVLDVIQDELEQSIERIEKGFKTSDEDMDSAKSTDGEKTFVVKKVMKEMATQTKSKGVKDKAVQADDLPFDHRDSIVRFVEYDFQHRLMLAERGHYNTDQLKFMIHYINAIPELKEKIFGFMEEPKLLIPKLKGHIDLELATVAGFQVVHEGSFQFLSYEDPPLHPDVLQQGELYYGEDSSSDASTNMAMKGSSSNASLSSSATLGSSPGSALKIIVHSTAKKVVIFSKEIINLSTSRSNNIFYRTFGLSSKMNWSPLIQSGGDSGLRSLASFIPRPFPSTGPWQTDVLALIIRRTFQWPWTTTDLRKSWKKMRQNKFQVKSPNEHLFRLVTQLRYFFFSQKNCDLQPIGYQSDSSSVITRNFFCQRTFKSICEIFLIKSFHEKTNCASKIYVSIIPKHICWNCFSKFKRRTKNSCDSSRSMKVRLLGWYFVVLKSNVAILVIDPLFSKIFILVHSGQFLTGSYLIWIDCLFLRQTTIFCTKQAFCDTMTLLFEINAVVDKYWKSSHHQYIMSAKMIAKFTVPDEDSSKYRAAELCGLDIKFPQLQFDIRGSRKGNDSIGTKTNLWFVKLENISVLEVSRKDFNEIVLPQIILLHINVALIETFAFSTFPLGRHIEARLPKWFHYQYVPTKNVEYPPWLARNGNITVQIYNPPSMRKLNALIRNATNFLMDTLANVTFVDGLDQNQLFILCNYPSISEDAKSIAKKLVRRLPSVNLGYLFGNTILDLFRSLDCYYHEMSYRNADIFDQIFTYGTIDSWKTESINADTLLRLARTEVPNMEREMFGIVNSSAISW